MMVDEASPLLAKMMKSATELVEDEKTQGASVGRKMLLGIMADLRVTTAAMDGTLRSFMLSGQANYRSQYEKVWSENEVNIQELSKYKDKLSPQQMASLNKYLEDRSTFSEIPEIMFETRSDKSANLAKYWLNIKAIPAKKSNRTIKGPCCQSTRTE